MKRLWNTLILSLICIPTGACGGPGSATVNRNDVNTGQLYYHREDPTIGPPKEVETFSNDYAFRECKRNNPKNPNPDVYCRCILKGGDPVWCNVGSRYGNGDGNSGAFERGPYLPAAGGYHSWFRYRGVAVGYPGDLATAGTPYQLATRQQVDRLERDTRQLERDRDTITKQTMLHREAIRRLRQAPPATEGDEK